MLHERFERAIVAYMPEFATKHVESNSIRTRLGLARKDEPCFGIDKVLDQPRGADPVDLRSWPGLPHAAAVSVDLLVAAGAFSSAATRALFEFLHQLLGLFPLSAPKTIDRV